MPNIVASLVIVKCECDSQGEVQYLQVRSRGNTWRISLRDATSAMNAGLYRLVVPAQDPKARGIEVLMGLDGKLKAVDKQGVDRLALLVEACAA